MKLRLRFRRTETSKRRSARFCSWVTLTEAQVAAVSPVTGRCRDAGWNVRCCRGCCGEYPWGSVYAREGQRLTSLSRRGKQKKTLYESEGYLRLSQSGTIPERLFSNEGAGAWHRRSLNFDYGQYMNNRLIRSYSEQFSTTPDLLHVVIPRLEIVAEMTVRGEDDTLNDVCLAVAVVADAIASARANVLSS